MKSNVIRIYKNILSLIENPVGANTEERALVRNRAIIQKAKYEQHFKTAKKYKDDAEIQELIKPKETKEKKDNGKKSKR